MRPFSVLVSVYFAEKSSYFDTAIRSIWFEQTLKPSEIVLVKDGPLGEALEQTIARWQTTLGDTLKVITLERNMGLGHALRLGLEQCTHDIVARMDTDDIAHPERFRKQIDCLADNPKIDIVGSNVSEFILDATRPEGERTSPVSHNEIVEYARSRNPFNHPSVVYRKEAVVAAGDYQDALGFEDYFLWVRMIHNGSVCQNIPENLVNMRSGPGMLARRGGLQYMLREVRLFLRFYRAGYIGLPQLVKNICIRAPVRIAPLFARRLVYKAVRMFTRKSQA